MFLHRKFSIDRLHGKRVLDIGCGRKKREGATGLDRIAYPGVDIVADLNGPLPVESSSYEVIYADQVLEHVTELIGLLTEVHRILMPGGMLVAHVPYFRSSWAHIDPTHVRHFTINTLDYFVEGTMCNRDYNFGTPNFSKLEVYLDADYRSTPARALFTGLALKHPFRFENSMLAALFPFEQLTYVLTK